MSETPARIQYEFAEFRLDLQQRLLLSASDGRPIPLSPKVFDTLLYLVERRGELLDKATLLKAIWPNVVVEENNLNQNISVLRRVLGENPGEHRFILTEPGRGYRFVADVRTLAVSPPAPETKRETSRATTGTAPRIDAPARSSIAVLPFANLTGDPAKEYFSDGMAEELIHTLGRVPGLKVPSRTSSFSYKRRDIDLRQIARDLEVDAVLEGSVRSAGERIRVTAQLVDARSGYHVWSQNYDRQFEDLFKLQDELASAIVQALRAHLHADLPSLAVQAPPTKDLDAYELFLQAASLLSRAHAEDVYAAQRLAEQAIARDPEFARAHSTLGSTYLVMAFFGLSSGPGGDLDKAEEAGRRALALNSDLLSARALLASVSSFRGDWIPARRAFESALALSASDPMVHQSYGTFLSVVGHTREALQELGAARRLAPANGMYASLQAVVCSMLGLDADALRYAEQAVNLGTPRGSLAVQLAHMNAAFRRGDFAQAAVHMASALPAAVREAGGADTVRLIYAARADSSKRAAAIEALRDLQAHAPGMDSGIMVIYMMDWYTTLGALDDAYAVAEAGSARLQRARSIGGNWGGLWRPEMRPFKQDPRFQGFAQRLGLMEYWNVYGPPDDCELRDGKLICQ
jgi:TolB-like protein